MRFSALQSANRIQNIEKFEWKLWVEGLGSGATLGFREGRNAFRLVGVCDEECRFTSTNSSKYDKEHLCYDHLSCERGRRKLVIVILDNCESTQPTSSGVLSCVGDPERLSIKILSLLSVQILFVHLNMIQLHLLPSTWYRKTNLNNMNPNSLQSPYAMMLAYTRSEIRIKVILRTLPAITQQSWKENLRSWSQHKWQPMTTADTEKHSFNDSGLAWQPRFQPEN